MTIKELVAILQTHPPDRRVVVPAEKAGYNDLTVGTIETREITLDYFNLPNFGRHADEEYAHNPKPFE